jgi:hypothetical protein
MPHGHRDRRFVNYEREFLIHSSSCNGDYHPRRVYNGEQGDDWMRMLIRKDVIVAYFKPLCKDLV